MLACCVLCAVSVRGVRLLVFYLLINFKLSVGREEKIGQREDDDDQQPGGRREAAAAAGVGKNKLRNKDGQHTHKGFATCPSRVM